MKKVVSLVGARPQFVKAAVVSASIQKNSNLAEVLVHSGQHYDFDMSAVFFEQLSIPSPNHHLEVGSGSHGHQTAEILAKFEDVLISESPDIVLVYGDTNTTLAGALAASKLHIPIAHIESGLRSFNRRMPEEINRIVTDSISNLLFTPTTTATEQLLKEGHAPEQIRQVGDVMYDAMLTFGELASSQSAASIETSSEQLILATIHRAENTDNPTYLRNILGALSQLSSDFEIILPLHPRTRRVLEEIDIDLGEIKLLPPASFFDMLVLESRASLILTDSGGVQKEAYFNRVPCVTVRTETEWIELVEHGWNRLAPPVSQETIISSILESIGTRGSDDELYGNGTASPQIAESLASMN